MCDQLVYDQEMSYKMDASGGFHENLQYIFDITLCPNKCLHKLKTLSGWKGLTLKIIKIN